MIDATGRETAMLKSMWNYAIKSDDIGASLEFYIECMGAELKLTGEVFGCHYHLVRMGETRLLIFDRAPYEEQHGMDLPPGFLHVVYEVDDHDAHVEKLREAGVRFLMEPQEIDIAVGRRKIAFFEDLNGIRTEVMQIIEDAGNT